jgi:hypothetical protein
MPPLRLLIGKESSYQNWRYIPTFDSNILNWRSFWEQFCVPVHDRSSLSDSEKLVYLQHSLKNGSAKKLIEGLSRSGEFYVEAIECLKAHYDRPRLIHQTHVCMVLEAPALKDGTGRELRRLHDTVQQHLRALKAMDYEPSGPFITSALELKLDVNTMFEWQRQPGRPRRSSLSQAARIHQSMFPSIRDSTTQSKAE